jgi:hypothetical protein
MFGIETIKKAIGAVIGFGVAIEKAQANDGKVTITEAVSMSIASIPDVFSIAKNIGKLKDEYQDLTNAEREEIKDWVVTEFDIDNDYVEQKIEAAFEVAVSVEKFFAIKKSVA